MEEIKEIFRKIRDLSLESKDLTNLISFLLNKAKHEKTPLKTLLENSIEWLKVIAFLLKKYEDNKFGISGDDWRKDQIEFERLKRIIDEMDIYSILKYKTWALGGNCFFKVVDKIEFLEFLYEKLEDILTKISPEIKQEVWEEERKEKNRGLDKLLPKERDMLLKIYIGQNINEGILRKFKEKLFLSKDEEKIVCSLISKGFIKEIYPYSIKSIKTLITLMKGSSISRRLIGEKLKEGDKILEELKDIPKKVMGFLLLNTDSLIFNLKGNEEVILEWEEFLLNNQKVSEFLIKLCKTLEKYGLAVSTNNYVSSKGGRIDPKDYVIPMEVKNYLVNHLHLCPLNSSEINEVTLLYTLYQIKDEILTINDDERRRNSYWNLLQGLPFDESSIQNLIEEFEKEKITTKYYKINEEKFLFLILNKKKFEDKLSQLVDQLVLGISKELERRKDLIKTKDILELHSELFALIGNFETKIRKYILDEMKLEFSKNEGCWEDRLKEIELFDKLESRKNQDIENGMIPEEEIIYYADILDYKEIIIKNWSIFSDRMLDKRITLDILKHGLNEVNRMRRKVMHLREIRKGESDTLKFFILPKLEKIFGN